MLKSEKHRKRRQIINEQTNFIILYPYLLFIIIIIIFILIKRYCNLREEKKQIWELYNKLNLLKIYISESKDAE